MASEKSSELKQLQTRVLSLRKELSSIETNISKNAEKRNNITERLQNYESKIDRLLKKDPVVTEHAILRFLERYNNFDRDEAINQIMPEEVKEAIMKLGDGNYPVNNMFTIIVRNNQVVTVK